MYLHKCTHTHPYTHVRLLAHTYTPTHTCIHISKPNDSKLIVNSLCVLAFHTYTYVHTHSHTYTYLHIYTYIHSYTYKPTQSYIYTHTYTHTYTQPLQKNHRGTRKVITSKGDYGISEPSPVLKSSSSKSLTRKVSLLVYSSI